MDPNDGGVRNPFDSVQWNFNPDNFKRWTRLGVWLLMAVLVITAGTSMVGPWTDYLWFVHDVRYPQVFEIEYSARGALFVVSFLVSWLLLQFNLSRAFRITLVFVSAPSSQGQRILTNAIGYLQTQGGTIIRFAAPIFAFITASDFSNEFSTYLLASHGQKFGINDPTYGLDVGFFVFSLPWYLAVANFATALLTLTTALTIGIYAGIQGLAAIAKVELGRPAIRKHIHFLIGVTVLVYAFQLYLRTFQSGLIQSQQFTGAGLADSVAVGVQRWIAIGALAIAFGTILNGWIGKPFQVPVTGGILFVLAYAVGVIIVPAGVQRFLVGPNRLQREAPFAKKAIDMTRFAYGLDKIEVRAQNPTTEPTLSEVSQSKTTLDNMRLWDPDVLQNCLETFQGIRPYYRFFDVDVDRYPINGKETLLMLAPRQLDLGGLLPNAQNWTSERLLYTHGYGVAVARVDGATTEGEPLMLDLDIPQRAIPELAISEPRIYFGDEHDEYHNPVDEYAIVNTNQAEFDYPTSDSDIQTRWTGNRGIPMGSFFSRVALTVLLGDINVLVSSSTGPDSKLLMHRNILERASRVYPFLTFDSDPYVFLSNGKVQWMLDGYTKTDMVPYSALSPTGTGQLNYIRNSVKVVIDAYTGETTAYSVDDSEPILRAWRQVYPNLIKPQAEAPAGVVAHYRYPEDLLTLQSEELNFYHVENPSVFLGNGDIWSIAAQRGLRGDREPIHPFYVEMKLPDEPKTEFVQILPFSPNGRPTMTGWLAAHCDPGVYGHLTLYRLSQSNPISGPEQIEGAFSTTPEIANINKQFQNQNSSIVVGNLLVIPIGNSFMYAESLFLKSNTQNLQSVPRLTKVILAVNGRTPVVKDTYREALAALFGGTSEPEATLPNVGSSNSSQNSTAPASQNPTIAQAKQVLDKLDQADAALRKGDFAAYGELEKQARQELSALTHKK